MLPQSLSYDPPMRRFIALTALLFALASVAGMTTAHAHRYVSTPIVVLNHVDDSNRPIPVVIEVQRGQIDLGSGIFMPCGPHQAIPVSVAQLPPLPACATPSARIETTGRDGIRTRLLRPPIPA